MVVVVANKTVSILGIPFIHTTLKEMIQRIEKHVDHQEKKFIVTVNPEIVIAARQNPEYKKMIQQADYITADGIGIVKAAQMLGTPLPERVTGFDMFVSLLQLADQKKYRIYLLGAKEEVIEKTVANIKEKYPNAQIAGYHHGYFNWKETKIEEEIIALKPDFVFVALGFPKQEQWISERIHLFDRGIFMGIGGSFDVLAGEVKRAPFLWQKLNLEWLYRLIQQPSRWRRMLALPKFIFIILKQKAMGKNE